MFSMFVICCVFIKQSTILLICRLRMIKTKFTIIILFGLFPVPWNYIRVSLVSTFTSRKYASCIWVVSFSNNKRRHFQRESSNEQKKPTNWLQEIIFCISHIIKSPHLHVRQGFTNKYPRRHSMSTEKGMNFMTKVIR